MSKTKLTATLLKIKKTINIFLIWFMVGCRKTTYKRAERSGSELVLAEDIVEEAENIVKCFVESDILKNLSM